MALLGTLIDVVRGMTFGGAANTGGPLYYPVTGGPLPGQPDYTVINPLSVQVGTSFPFLALLRGTLSTTPAAGGVIVNTMAVFSASVAAASQQLLAADCISIVAHSLVR